MLVAAVAEGIRCGAVLTGEAGVIAMEDDAGAGIGVPLDAADAVGAAAGINEQAAVTMVKAAINPIIRQYPVNRICFLFIAILPLLLASTSYGNSGCASVFKAHFPL